MIFANFFDQINSKGINRKISCSHIIKINLLFFILFCAVNSIAIAEEPGPSDAITDIHANLSDNSTAKCIECHISHITGQSIESGSIQSDGAAGKITGMSYAPITQSIPATSNVAGNITMITSLGQNWYQQGIYGANTSSVAIDKSWGWTFFDETPPSGFIIPPEKVTQRNRIYAMLLDSGNNSSPITGAQVTANVTYWLYDGNNYTDHTIQIQLYEEVNKPGFYSGDFYFYGGTQYSGGDMFWCDGCHLSYYGSIPDTQIGYFPGNYTVSITALADSKIASKHTDFQVTPWGCEDCHGSGNQHSSSSNINLPVAVDMDSACYLCHGINQITHDTTDGGNPHQNNAHRNIECTACHTDKGLDMQSFNGVTFIQGGINNKYLPQYDYSIIQLNTGAHENLTCIDCHNDLTLFSMPGGFKQDNYTVSNTINSYNPGFASIQQFQHYYVIDVTSGGPLNLTFNWEGSANLGFYLYPPNFNPRNRTNPMKVYEGDYPYYNGSTFTNKPEKFSNTTPLAGKWILTVYGYNLRSDWVGELQLPISYTINSTYPIQQQDLPLIPECNGCHNAESAGNAFTEYDIQDWNPGYSHVDINNDSSLDIQCRMCHNQMHDITIKGCQDCHITAPINHAVDEPEFSQYTPAQCLACHGDPHNISAGSGGSCTGCHSDVSSADLGLHSTLNGSSAVDNGDCNTCHYASFPMVEGAANTDNTYYCADCHTPGGTGPNKSSRLFIEKKHGQAKCIDCHIADGTYHQNNPHGAVANMAYVNRQSTGNLTVTDCADCHYASNLDDAPFNAPGGGSHTATACADGGCHATTTAMKETVHNVNGLGNTAIKPAISVPALSSGNVPPGIAVTVTATVTAGGFRDYVDGAQYRLRSGSTDILPWTPMQAVDGNFDGTSEAVTASINTASLYGSYSVEVRGMAGGPRQNVLIRYYPMNGNVSLAQSAALVVEFPPGYVNGTVRDSDTGTGIADAAVSINTIMTTTNSNGAYSLQVPPGSYTLNVAKSPEYFANTSVTVDVISGVTTYQDINLLIKPTGTINGTITSS